MSSEEQLSALLYSDQFSVASYLNLALDETTDQQQRLAELALQLQIETQSCHEEIGKIGAELQAILPRCSADIGRVGVGLEGLKSDAASLLENTAPQISEQVSSSLETLSTLHALTANLQRSKEVLAAAATWDSTLSSIAPLLAQQNITEAVNALTKLENGERALRGMPNPEEREQAIARVGHQVSALLQPQLKHAVANMNTRLAPLQQCVALYSKLGRLDVLKAEYVRSRPANIHKSWFEYKMVYDEGQDRKASHFLQWLSGWFDAILSLVSEERRQSISIFGADESVEVVIKILAECFKPLKGSFRSRLETLCNPNSSTDKLGSLDAICEIYEGTLRFLSLVYEAVVNGWMDLVEAGTIVGDGGLQLFQSMSKVFVDILEPFSVYQKNLSKLESDFLTDQIKEVGKNTQQAVRSTSFDMTVLQTATDSLESLSVTVFPILERAVGRFELLKGGYGPDEAISTIDGSLSGHTAELTMAIKTLSAAIIANERDISNNFDESHVLAALSILKVAGTFQRSMSSLERKTRDRLVVLRERVEEQISREKATNSETKTLAGRKAYMPSESLSPVDIDSIVTRAVLYSNEGLTSPTEQLQRFIAESTIIFVEADESTRRLISSCHTLVFDVCFSVPRMHIADMLSLSSWRESNQLSDMDSYGTLPQRYVNEVGEHLLALVQALEPFTSDKPALQLAVEVMDGVRDVAKPAWRDVFAAAEGIQDFSPADLDEIMSGSSLGELLGKKAPIIDEDDTEMNEDDEESAGTAFCDKWLDVVGLSVTGSLLERILRIPSLSTKGCSHLNADLSYLVNVFSALGIAGHPHPLLSHLAEVSVMDVNVLEGIIATRDRSQTLSSLLYCLEEHILRAKRTA